MFTKGQEVVQILPSPFAGKVAGFSLDQENGEVLVLVVYSVVDGDVHNRYFRQSEVVAA